MFRLIALALTITSIITIDVAISQTPDSGSTTELRQHQAQRRFAEGNRPASAEQNKTPMLTITGGNQQQRADIEWAVARFAEAGLPLPPLDIHVHDDASGCLGERGLYRWGDKALNRIDMCADTMFVLLHEIGHAWEVRFATDEARDVFTEAVGLVEWRSDDVEWGDRASERAANTIAFAMLPRPLTQSDVLANAEILARFTALTGVESPRLPAG